MARGDDIYDMPGNIQDEHERLDTAVEDGRMHPEDRDAIVRYDQYRDVEVGVKNSTRYADLKHLRVAAIEASTPLTSIECSEDVTPVVHAIKYRRGHDNPLSASTMHKYRCCLRGFYEYQGREWWDAIDGTLNQDRTSQDIDIDDMLTESEIESLVREVRSVRDEALIEMLADTGARISLLATLRVGDIELDTNRPVFSPNEDADGLKDVPNKPYPLIDSPAVIRRYLNRKHPRADDEGAPLFHKHPEYYDPSDPGDDGALSYSTIRSFIDRAAERAGIETSTNPHNFRHTAITRMMGDDMFTQDDIRHRVGWTKDTQMWGVYDHLDAESRNENLFKRTGVIEPDTTDEVSRFPCGNCGTVVQSSRQYCGQCGAAISGRARAFQDSARDAAGEAGESASDPVEAVLWDKLGEKLDMAPEAVRAAFEADHS